jgi:hypothetical protein
VASQRHDQRVTPAGRGKRLTKAWAKRTSSPGKQAEIPGQIRWRAIGPVA